jgi:DNA ligase (NAD+)
LHEYDNQVRYRQTRALRGEIDYHNYHYFVFDSPIISDDRFDRPFRKLQALEAVDPELVTPDSPAQRVCAKSRTEFVVARYAIPMGSLDIAFADEEVEA